MYRMVEFRERCFALYEKLDYLLHTTFLLKSTILYCYSFLRHEARQPTVLIPCRIDLSNGKGTHHSTGL